MQTDVNLQVVYCDYCMWHIVTHSVISLYKRDSKSIWIFYSGVSQNLVGVLKCVFVPAEELPVYFKRRFTVSHSRPCFSAKHKTPPPCQRSSQFVTVQGRISHFQPASKWSHLPRWYFMDRVSFCNIYITQRDTQYLMINFMQNIQ